MGERSDKLGLFLGLLLYAIAVFDFSWITSVSGIYISHVYESVTIFVGWLACFVALNHFRTEPLVRYWWVIPSFLIIIYRVFPMLFALIAWLSRGFAP
jgi:hypothetical protein